MLRRVCQTGSLLACLVNVGNTSGSRCADDRNGDRGKQDERGNLGQLGVRDSRIVLLGLSCRYSCLGAGEQAVVLVVGCSMEEEVVGHEKDLGELLEVICHHSVLRWSLGQSEKHVDIFNTPESFLPELQLVGNIELSKSCLEMSLQGIRLIEVDRMHLR